MFFICPVCKWLTFLLCLTNTKIVLLLGGRLINVLLGKLDKHIDKILGRELIALLSKHAGTREQLLGIVEARAEEIEQPLQETVFASNPQKQVLGTTGARGMYRCNSWSRQHYRNG